MPPTVRFDHVGITVTDLDTAVQFFLALGLLVEGRTLVEGPFADAVIGIPGSRVDMVLVRPPDGGTGLELSCFLHPEHDPGTPEALSNTLGLRNVTLEVDDLVGIVDRLAAQGYGVVGAIGVYEGSWRMAQVRGPDGILVGLAERLA